MILTAAMFRSRVVPGLRRFFLLGAAVVSIGVADLGAAHAQDAGPQGSFEPAPPGPPAAAPAKVWAFTGAWTTPFVAGVIRSGIIPLKPAYQTKLEQLQKLALAGAEVPGNEERCIPNGMPMMLNSNFQIFADASRIVLMNNSNQNRYIWIDGRKHTSADVLVDTFSGESIGHWEGDTLVVDTVGLKSSNEINFGLAPTHMHIVERWRLLSPVKLQIGVTIEDPTTLTKPWSYTIHYTRGAVNSFNQVCAAATDRDFNRATGKQGFDLTPPAGGYIPPGVAP